MNGIVILGAPASGKGILSAQLVKKYSIPHIVVEDLLMNCCDNKVINIIHNGLLPNDDIITEVIKKRLSMEDCKSGFILDDYPKTLRQAELLDKTLLELNYFISSIIELQAPIEELLDRVSNRKICSNCNYIYGKYHEIDKSELCPICGGSLFIRKDDDQKMVISRITEYNKNITSLRLYYNILGNLRIFNTRKGIKDIVKNLN